MSGVKSAFKRVISLPDRVREVESDIDLLKDLAGHSGSDIIKLEEEQAKQREFNAQIKWILGSTFEAKEVES